MKEDKLFSVLRRDIGKLVERDFEQSSVTTSRTGRKFPSSLKGLGNTRLLLDKIGDGREQVFLKISEVNSLPALLVLNLDDYIYLPESMIKALLTSVDDRTTVLEGKSMFSKCKPKFVTNPNDIKNFLYSPAHILKTYCLMNGYAKLSEVCRRLYPDCKILRECEIVTFYLKHSLFDNPNLDEKEFRKSFDLSKALAEDWLHLTGDVYILNTNKFSNGYYLCGGEYLVTPKLFSTKKGIYNPKTKTVSYSSMLLKEALDAYVNCGEETFRRDWKKALDSFNSYDKVDTFL